MMKKHTVQNSSHYIQDPLAIDLLKSNAYSENSALSSNCASTLAAMGDVETYNKALSKLNSNDDFEKLDAVKFFSFIWK